MNHPDDLSTWAADFRADGHVPPATLLLKTVRADTRRQRLAVGAEVLASAALVAFYTVLLSVKHHPVLVVLGLGTMLFVGVWLTRLFLLLKGLWRAPTHTARAYAELTLARRRAALDWMRFVERCVVGLALAGLAWMPWKLWVDAAMYTAEPWRAVVGVGGFYALLGGLAVWARRGLRRARAEHDALAQALPGLLAGE